MPLKYFSIFLIITLCIFNVGLSVSTTLIKSPEVKAKKLVQLSDQYLAKSSAINLDLKTQNFLIEQSQHFLIQASILTPYNTDIWQKIKYNNASDAFILANRASR